MLEYIVWANTETYPRFLGVYSGLEEDIRAALDDHKVYGLDLQVLNVQTIPEGYAKRRQNLIELRTQLEKQLQQLNNEIKRL